MNINSTFPSNYIKASDLDGRAVNVTIRDIKVEQIGRDRDTKPVLYFEGKQKGLVLNKTNARKIANLIGSMDTDDWPGHKIAIFPTETEFGGEQVECIRVKAAETRNSRTAQAQAADSFDSAEKTTAPVKAAPQPAPITDDDIPFAWLLPLVLPTLAAFGSVVA